MFRGFLVLAQTGWMGRAGGVNGGNLATAVGGADAADRLWALGYSPDSEGVQDLHLRLRPSGVVDAQSGPDPQGWPGLAAQRPLVMAW